MLYIEHVTWICSIVILVMCIMYMSYDTCDEYFMEHFGSDCGDFLGEPVVYRGSERPGVIFVSVASYRDDECSITIRSIFEKAGDPSNIVVGVCEQNRNPEESCVKGSIHSKYHKQIRIKSMDYKEAKGPTYARYHVSTLWEGEEYYLQIDSHTSFEKNWDLDLIHMFKQCKKYSDRPILTVYPPTADQMKGKGAPEMCFGRLSNDKIPIFLAGWDRTLTDDGEPKRSPKPFIAAGFMFLQGKFVNEVPFDPRLPHLFQGEETLLSARLWTSGYDFFTPNRKVCSHHYTREGKPKYWDDHKDHTKCRVQSEKRILFLLGLGDKPSDSEEFFRQNHRYGFGRVRKLADYWKEAGIDFTKKGKEAISNKCTK